MDANKARPTGRYGAGGTDDAGGTGSEGGAPYIRLRYSMQFTTGGRAHTIEMEVPVPVGASAELREQLIREAEASMEQLYRRVEARARGQRPPDSAQRSGAAYPQHPQHPQYPQQPAQPAPQSPPPPSQPAQALRPAQRPQGPPAPAAPPSPSPMPSSTPAREGPQPISLQDRRAGAGVPSSASPAATAASTAAQARSAIPGELLVTPGLASAGSGAMKLSEFIQIIRESWGLTAKQAMDLLQVKSLNNMNYRDLLRQLEALVDQSSSSPRPPAPSASTNQARPAMPASSSPPQTPSPSRPPLPSAPQRETGQPSSPAAPQRPSVPPPARPSSSSSSPSPPSLSPDLAGPPNIPVYPLREGALREAGRVYKFDEEDEEQEGQDAAAAKEEEGSMSEAMARIKIDELRDLRGAAAANPGRLVVLHNLLDSQISDEQFLQLIERLWNTVSDKKLRQDQVEALISWAKEDYFEDEVRAVLGVLNEQ
jgi:hypothetical protein